MIRRSSQLLLKEKYACNLFLANSYARAGAQWLAGQSFDVIVAPNGAFDIAFLETNIPIVLIEDATCGLLFDYYPAFSGLLTRSIYEMNTLQALALKKASAMIYSSTWAARSAIEDYGADPAKVHVVPFGANFDESPAQDVALARKPSERCRLLFLAAGWARKGGDIAFETLLKLEELGIAAELIVCGCTPPKGFVHERLRVIPFLDKNDQRQGRELEQLFMESDFLLLPTRADCTPIVFCEANACGLPVITTNTGGVSEVVRDGENGFLLPYEASGAAYAEVIARLYRDEQRYVQLARTSRAEFERRLNWDAWGVAVKHILAELLDHESSRSQQIEVQPKKAEDISVKEEFIPTSIQPLIDAYLHALEPLRSHFYGIYLQGSIAFGAFEELGSDIDIVALTHGEWTTQELAQLNALHTKLIEAHQRGNRLDVLYVPLRNLGKCNRKIAPYPTFQGGNFSPARYGDLNYITWWTVKNKSIRLLGPERSTLPIEVTWQDVLETMRNILHGYWVSRARRPYLFRRDGWFEFAVATHCRILTTIEEGEIITKSVALKRWRDRLPARWRPLIDETWRIRYHLDSPTLYRSRLKRAIEVLAFMKYVRERENKALEDLLRGERAGVDPETLGSPSITLLRRER
jgi:glycosyltransferase involved in cell wall biosynthesis